MKKYEKIQTIYYRDPETNHKTLIHGKWSLPEFELLRNIDWVWTEKIDGTNIRVIWNGDNVYFLARNDHGNIPKPLRETLEKMFKNEYMREAFGDTTVCLYGEGFGHGIQKVGSNYIEKETSFILFDCMINDMWLSRESIEGIAKKLLIPIVPIIGIGSLIDAIRLVEEGFTSLISQDRSLIAEGLIVKPKVELLNRNHSRIISKIKHRDFIYA